MDTFCHSLVKTNTQGENANTILTNERINNSDALAEPLRGLIIKIAGYYNSEKNDAEGGLSSSSNVDTHTSDGNIIIVTDTINRNLQQKSLINWTLLIITTPIDIRIKYRVETCGRVISCTHDTYYKAIHHEREAQQRARFLEYTRSCKQEGQGRHHSTGQ